eukprot:GEMP01011064.1.p1 GENE.GEMP01011064.1~~GEMP01011064.1.p1  ORF type:complete len:550 (+),score=77.00 GEMP01011064.1:299-1948(+)
MPNNPVAVSCHPSDVWIPRWQFYLMMIIQFTIVGLLYRYRRSLHLLWKKVTMQPAEKNANEEDGATKRGPVARVIARFKATGAHSTQHVDKADKPRPKRLHYLDFARSVLIGGVVIFHVAERVSQLYGDSELRHGVKTVAQYRQYKNSVEGWFILGWAFFPSFFYVSGRASAMTKETRIWKIMTHTLRFIPVLLVASLLLVVPVAYLSLQQRKSTNQDYFAWLGNRDGHFVKDITYTGFGWLWFLPVLMFVEILQAPLLCTLKESLNAYIMLAYATLFFIISALFIDLAVAMISVAWACITVVYLLHQRFPRAVPMTPVSIVTIVVISLIAVNVRGEVSELAKKIRLHDAVFFSLMQSLGIVHGKFPSVSAINGWILLPLCILGAFTTGFCLPDVAEPRVYSRFPPYKPEQSYAASRFVVLSWIALYCLISLPQSLAVVTKGHPFFHAGMTMYLVHWPLLEVFLDLFIAPHLCKIPAEIGLILMVILTFAACWATHFFLFPLRSPKVGEENVGEDGENNSLLSSCLDIDSCNLSGDISINEERDFIESV